MPRPAVALALVFSLLVPMSGPVLCVESDGRIAVEAGIGGRCADLVLAQRAGAAQSAAQEVCDTEASCRDSLLSQSGNTVSKEGRGDDASSTPLVVATLRVTQPSSQPDFAGHQRGWSLLPRQYDQIASVVILR